MSFLSGVVKFFKGGNIGSTLVKTALLGYAVSRLSKSAIKDNGGGTENIDKGVRLQVAPNADSKIPVLYGTAFFGGNITDAQMTNNNKTMWYCVVLSEKTGARFSNSADSNYIFKDVYWNNQRIIFNSDGITVNYTVDKQGNVDRSLSGLVKVYCYQGNSELGVQPEGYLATIPNAYDVFPEWTEATHPMDNLVFALVRVDYNREKNVTGIGDMLFHIENDTFKPGDVIYDYLTSTRYGAGIAAGDILTTTITALNTYSDAAVNYDDEGTGAETLADRYQINGLIDTANPVLQNAEAILSATASWLSYDSMEGKWSVVINRAGSSIASFNDSNILGSISLSGTGLQDLYNNVKVEFPHRDLRDSGDFVNIELDEEFRNSNEEDNVLNLKYDIINEPVQAQLLGFIELKQSRVDLVIRFQTDFSYINLKAGDLIDVTNSRVGFSSKVFRITSITEVQDDGEALLMEITALEYDSDVYSTADLYRFTRTNADGIISIGSIGTPGTPQVTKVEIDSRPRIVIESTAPTGVVEGMEFWLTNDAAEPVDANRSYSLIGTILPVGGGVFTSGTTVTLEYASLPSGSFYVKTRGFNTTTVGSYSDPSGLIEFAPTQVTDAIGPDTGSIDPVTGLLTALAVVDLLKFVDDLITDLGGSSIIDYVKEGIEAATGIDFGDEAIQGPPGADGNNTIAVQEAGTSLSEEVTTLNFDCDVFSVTVEDGVATISCADGGGGGGGGTGQCFLRFSTLYPPNRTTFAEPVPGFGNADLAPTTGSYFIKFASSTNSFIPGTLVLGETGNIKLYKSNGTEVASIAAGSCTVSNNVLGIPFPNRDKGTDYYILMDAGVVEYCECISPAITDPQSWNFNTPLYDVAAYNITGDPGLRVTSHSYDTCPGGIFSLTFNAEVSVGSGTITFKKSSDDSTVGTIDASTGTMPLDSQGEPAGSTIYYADPEFEFEANTQYYITVPQGVATVNDGCSTGPNAAITNKSLDFTTVEALELVDIIANSYNFEPDDGEAKVNRQSNIGLVFNRNISLGTTGSLKINGHQTFPVTANFTTNKVSELIWTSANIVWLNPTVDFPAGATFTVSGDANSIRATCGEYWDGDTGSVDVSFTVDTGPTATVTNNTTTTGTVVLNYDRDVTFGAGNIRVVNSSGTTVSTISPSSPAITVS
jgi:hypothetical protein